jgi:hypothetical protein
MPKKKRGYSSNQKPYSEAQKLARYKRTIEEVFSRRYREGTERLVFKKDELEKTSRNHGILSENIPDIVRTYSRKPLPARILAKGNWVFEVAGRGIYAFRLLHNRPHFDLGFQDCAAVDIYNPIPAVVEVLLPQDQESLLTRVLYHRLVDIFTGLTCFHIRNHYCSFVTGVGEVELDALYVGVDKTGTLFVLPIEAKSQAESKVIGRTQLSRIARLVRQDFATLRRRILAVRDFADGTIAMIEFNDVEEPDDFGIVSVSRFRLIRRGAVDDTPKARK